MATATQKKGGEKVQPSRTEVIDLRKINDNSGQSRGMGVLPILRAMGHGVFEQIDVEKPAIWPMLLSDDTDEKNTAIALIDNHEPWLATMAEGIFEKGQLQAIGVREVGGEFDVIFGMSRALAKAYNYARHGEKSAPTIEAKIFEGRFSAVDLKLLSMDENLDRRDESPIDRALTYQWLEKEGGLTKQDIAKKTGQSDQNIRNYIKLLSPKLEDKRMEIHDGRMSVDRALKLLQKRKDDATAEDERVPAEKDTRNRLPGAKGLIKIYEARKQPKSVPDKLWQYYVKEDVRRFLAIALGLKFKPFVPLTAEQEAKEAEKEAKAKEAKEKAESNGAPAKIKVLSLPRKRAEDLLVALGKADARTWKDAQIQDKLEGIVNLVEEGQKMESDSLQKLLDKLVAGYKEGIKVRIKE